MPLSKTISRHVNAPRKVACLSALSGFIVFILFIVITLMLVWHQRSNNHNRLASHSQAYVVQGIKELKRTLAPLHSATQDSCAAIQPQLTQKAAFAGNIRAILLVSQNVAFCSSATGSMHVAVTQLSPDTQTGKEIDIQLLPGTPMVPDKPAIAVWMKTATGSGVLTTLNINLTDYLLMAAHQQEISGMAIVAGDKALTTWQQRVVTLPSLPSSPLKTILIPGYPMKLMLYGETLPRRDIHLVVLAGLLLGLFSGGVCFLVISLRVNPGKGILMGIKRGEFHVEYQPVIEACSGRVTGLEALLRWTHPTVGRISPDTFISFAEGKNLIIPLTRHLFDLVARDAHQLQHVITAGTSIGLNLSPKHLTDPDFRQDVERWLSAMPAGHYDYVFEITERTMVEKQGASEVFTWIQDRGIRIAIDDFGTGHSALIYLEKFRFDYLKIDRGFVQSIGLETVTSPVLDTVLTLARKLNLRTVAEGVETLEQAEWLQQRGVTHMQGFYFSPPRTVEQLTEYFIDESHRRPVTLKAECPQA